MRRALLKGGGLFALGLLPHGAAFYRFMTRVVMGTQGSHILKLHRVWPEIVREFTDLSGGSLEGRRLLVHESGWTPFLVFINYLLCGNGGALINTKITGARILDRHITDSINMALDLANTLKKIVPIPDDRIQKVDALRWRQSLEQILSETETTYAHGVSPDKLSLPVNSMDLLYSGGQLEHYRPKDFLVWISEAYRVMKPGGTMIVILDHRDHLYHFDKKLPFLYHYSLSETIYNITHFSPLLYHNRLLPDEVSKMFEDAGFQKVNLLRRPLPSKKWFEDGSVLEGNIGIERSKLSKRFKKVSADDLKTAAAQYIYRKPV